MRVRAVVSRRLSPPVIAVRLIFVGPDFLDTTIQFIKAQLEASLGPVRNYSCFADFKFQLFEAGPLLIE
jgi:hypothetical protein